MMRSKKSLGNCDVQAQPDQWFTETQVEYIQQVGVGHIAEEMDKTFSRFNRSGSALTYTPGDRPVAPSEPPPEPDDMRRIDFQCHPRDPLKVAEDWAEPVHCLICGATT
jgi:Zn ribbon nucleic-acid-binding protein